jgi:hypothetical protein
MFFRNTSAYAPRKTYYTYANFPALAIKVHTTYANLPEPAIKLTSFDFLSILMVPSVPRTSPNRGEIIWQFAKEGTREEQGGSIA